MNPPPDDFYSGRAGAYRLALDRLREVCPDLLEMARRGEAPVVLLRCKPHGHEMIRVTLHEDLWHEGDLFYLSTPDDSPHLSNDSKVAREAVPRPLRTACTEPGCGKLTSRGEVYCDDHRAAGLDTDVISATRTSFKCARCSYHEPKLSATLLETYIAAYTTGKRQIRIR